ncbi:MAG: AMP-binding protein [Pseudomonadota bacterium]
MKLPPELTPSEERADLVRAFFYWAGQRGDAIWLTQPLASGEVEEISWGEAARQVSGVAAYLRSLGLPTGSRIAIIGKNSAHWLLADLAIQAAGYVSVPIYPNANAETARHILAHSGAELLFVGRMEEFWEVALPGIDASLARIRLPLSPPAAGGDDWLTLANFDAADFSPQPRSPEALATIIYTSGSTGLPKGVMISAQTMAVVPLGMEQVFPSRSDDRLLSYLPLAHAAERAMVESLALVHGLSVFFIWSLDTFTTDLQRARPTVFFSIPRLWTRFYQGVNARIPLGVQRVALKLPIVSSLLRRKILTQLGLQDVRIAVTGSAPLPELIVQWYRGLGLELLEAYGMSENFGWSHSDRPGTRRPGYVGMVQPGVECRISEEGEILVRSVSNMLGYYGDEAQTRATLGEDGFLHTGDMGEVDAQDRLRITGRVKDLFKTSKGKYVAPVPIETAMGEHPDVEQVCITGNHQPQPWGLVQLSEASRERLIDGKGQSEVEGERTRLEASLAELLSSTNASLEEHSRLDYLVIVAEAWTQENDLLTPTLKIRRAAIEARYEGRADDWRASGKPVIWE